MVSWSPPGRDRQVPDAVRHHFFCPGAPYCSRRGHSSRILAVVHILSRFKFDLEPVFVYSTIYLTSYCPVSGLKITNMARRTTRASTAKTEDVLRPVKKTVTSKSNTASSKRSLTDEVHDATVK